MVKQTLVTVGWTLREHPYILCALVVLGIVGPGIVKLSAMLAALR